MAATRLADPVSRVSPGDPDAERLAEQRRHHAAPTVAALRAYAADVRDAELARALARLGDLSRRDVAVLHTLAQRVVDGLLHRPTRVLEADAAGADMAGAVRRLFRLEPEPERPACRPETISVSRGKESQEAMRRQL